MAHFAEVDSKNVVRRVLVVANENEFRAQEFLGDDLGLGGTWIQTSYNSRGGKRLDPNTNEVVGDNHFRFNYAAPGFTYDPERDAFIPPKPHPEAVLNEATCLWTMPTEAVIDEIIPNDLTQ